MSLYERLLIVLAAIPVASLEWAIWYGGMAGFAYVTLHVILARWLARRRISFQVPSSKCQVPSAKPKKKIQNTKDFKFEISNCN